MRLLGLQVEDFIPERPDGETWDVLVIGTGMGGSTAGYELARLGRRVLFVEKGKFLQGAPSTREAPPGGCGPDEARLLNGRWPRPIRGRTSFGDVEFFGPLGCGTGGSTSLYSAQLERFAPSDFRPKANFPDVRGAALPEAWPISYDDLLPFYRRAEALFDLCGTEDPLNPDGQAVLRQPPPLSERDQHIADAFADVGLHPYRSHVGFHRVDECFECFDLCLKHCKSDAGGRCLAPALVDHGARLLPECDVLELLAEKDRVRSVRARWKGEEIRLRAKVVVLAAGAFMTPVLLQNSTSRHWPNGLANRSGVVGRHLMLHTSDFILVDPGQEYDVYGPRKSLTFNDFYRHDGAKLGTVQSVGLPLVAPFILSFLRYTEEKDPRWWRRPVSRFLPALAEKAAHWFRRGSLFSTIVEDLPYAENRVIPDPNAPSGRRFQYTYPRELHRRNRRLRQLVACTVAPRLSTRVVTGGGNNLNYGHVCGTCRFGDDPETSALDGSNRAHGLDNLYVVDASFFPSSGGINPSLTVSANALRVGEIIHRRLGESVKVSP